MVALVNRTPAKAESLADAIRAVTRSRPAVYSDYREMLAAEKPDAVSLALPPDLNPEVAKAALAAGCHVIAEKPIAINLAEAAPMLSWAAQYGRVLMIAENHRYLASYRHAAQLIAEGVVGQPRVGRGTWYAHMNQDNPYYHTAWRQRPAHLGGYLSDAGVHHIAAFRQLFGEVEAVSGQVALLRPDLPPFDTLAATLRFRNGALVSYNATYALPGPETPLQVAGPDGTLLIGRDKVELWRKGQPSRYWEEPSQEDGMVMMYGDFARAIRTGQPPRATAAEALADLRVIAAILDAGATGQVVRLA